MARWSVPLLAAALLLAGCSGGDGTDPNASGAPAASESAGPSAPAQADVPFTDCGQQCEGEIDGAKYRILLPRTWNGTLLIYSHGYRSPVPAPPDYAPVISAAEPSPGYNQGGVPLARNLLAQGYALAGSGWASNGWAVSDGVDANADLYEFFSETVGQPQRVYLWGDSLGGLVTMETAENHPEWVDGAAPLCGVVGGIVANMDLAMDLAHGIRALIDPDLLDDNTLVEEASAARMAVEDEDDDLLLGLLAEDVARLERR
jgi:hypothetical protein